MQNEILSNTSDTIAINDVRTLCKRSWWAFLIGGIASVIFGVLAFINPGIALLVLSMFFAASVLVDGAVHVIGAIQNRAMEGWWWVLLLGAVSAVIGGYALLNPPVSMAAFVFLVAFLAVFMGVTLISLGRRVREEIDNEWLLYIAGTLSVIFGALIIMRPASGSISVVWIIATWAIVTGLFRIAFALKARSMATGMGQAIAAQRQ